MEQDRVNKCSHMFKTRLFEQSRSSLLHKKRLFKRKNKRLLIFRCFHFIYANSRSPFFSRQTDEFSTLARAVSIPQRTTDLASFSADGLTQWGHAGRRLKDYSCSPPRNTLLNNDNCDGREQAGYWAKTKATLTGRAKLSISSCYHCLIVSKCRSQGTKKRERQVPACLHAWVHVLCVCMSTRTYASTCEPAGFPIRVCVRACMSFLTSHSQRSSCISLAAALRTALMKPGWLLCNVSHAHFKQPANNVVFMSAPRQQMQMRCQTNRGILQRACNSNNIFSCNPKWGQWPALWNKFKNIQCVALWQLGDHPLYTQWGDLKKKEKGVWLSPNSVSVEPFLELDLLHSFHSFLSL